MIYVFSILLDLLDGPFQGGAKCLVRHRSAGFANGLQTTVRPVIRTDLPQFEHEQAVRQHYQVHVPCLALAVAKLTISHAQLLLSVPMIGFCSCPAMSIRRQDATHFPCRSVRYKNLTRLGVAPMIPNNQRSHFVIHLRNVHGASEIPLPLVATANFLAGFRRDRGGQLVGSQRLAFPFHFAIEFQVANISPRLIVPVAFRVNVIQIFGMREIAIEDEISRYFPLASPIHQLTKQLAVILESFAGGLTLVAFFEAAEIQWVMLTVGANIVGEQVVLCNLVTLFSMIPIPAHVLDELAVVIDEAVVESNRAVFTVGGRRIFLQQLQPPLIEQRLIPIRLREKAIQARLVSRLDELTVDAADRFVFRHHQACEILGEVLPLRFVSEQVAEGIHGFANNTGKLDDGWHERTLSGSLKRPDCPGLAAPGKNASIKPQIPHFHNVI